MIPGIDLVGSIEETSSDTFTVCTTGTGEFADNLLLPQPCFWQMGWQQHCKYCKVPDSRLPWLVACPRNFSFFIKGKFDAYLL